MDAGHRAGPDHTLRLATRRNRSFTPHVLSIAELHEIAEQYGDVLKSRVAEFSVGGRRLRFHSRKAIMGVINLSTDSWYRESVCLHQEMAVERLTLLKARGADIIDIGAESTLPHASRAHARHQIDRLVPLVSEGRRLRVPVSVETYSAPVAEACLEAGASVINLTGNAGSPRILKGIAEHQAAVILCYVQGRNVRDVDRLDFDGDPVAVMYEHFARRVEQAVKLGVNRIFIDPGMGFYYRNLEDSAARVRYQMKTFLETFRLRALGFPICHALPHAFEFFGEEVRSAEPFFAVLAALGGTDLFRTHEVARTRAVLDTMAAWR